ncbi:MAG: hypothetical protein PHU06_07405 [Gallionella sp.]|nr:hypothetical protein [Gallionella sp.]MDD4959530.1 hypothetical protein [Gallionella sp.]
MRKFLIFCLLLVTNIGVAIADNKVVSAIEIGSKGIKAVAYQISGFDNEGQYVAKKIFDQKINPTIMSGVVDGNLKTEKIEETTKAVDTLFRQLKLLDPQFIVIVSSSSFEKISKSSRIALEKAIRDITGQDIRYISGSEEIYYGLLSCVPQSKMSGSILIDIGSGNTKLGYSTSNANGFESVTLKYGTVTLKEAAMASGNFKDNLTALYNSDVGSPLRKAIQDKPGLANLNRRIYIVGGASWAAANMARPQDIEKQYVTLKLSEIMTLNRQLLDRDYNPNNISPNAEKTITKIMDVFTPEDLQSGTTILTLMLKDLGGDRRKIIFPREGGWVVGYMFAQYNGVNK